MAALIEEIKKRVESLGANSFTFSEYELRESLRLLEEENIIQILGNKKSQTIRLIGYQFQ